MIGNAPRSSVTGVPGWLESDEEDCLIDYARQVPDGGIIVNIGVEFGRSMAAFVKTAPNAKVYGVEINPQDAYAANLTEAGLTPPNLVVGSSSDPAVLARFKRNIRGKQVDVILIDGGHSYEEAFADLTNWSPLIRVGGVMLVHDTATESNPMPHPLHHEVSRAINTWLKTEQDKWKTEKVVRTLMVLRRIGDA